MLENSYQDGKIARLTNNETNLFCLLLYSRQLEGREMRYLQQLTKKEWMHFLEF